MFFNKIFKKKYFNAADEAQIVEHIRRAEEGCSGEIRLYVESKVTGGNIDRRAVVIFKQLKMEQTHHRNGVLIYLASKDKRFAVLGDEGIHQKVGLDFWNHQAHMMKSSFKEGHLVKGICHSIDQIGIKLKAYFPLQGDQDAENELPNEPVYGN